MNRKLLKRITKFECRGNLIPVTGKLYKNKKHYYHVDSEGVEHKYTIGEIEKLYKVNTFNGKVKVINL